MKAVCLVIRPSIRSLRAKMKASRSGRFRKNRAPENRPTHFPMPNHFTFRWSPAIVPKACSRSGWIDPLTLEQRELLDAFAAQLALFVNKERALEESRAAQLARQSEKLQKALFDSVSHELKTPLAAMSAALQQPQPDRAELQASRRVVSLARSIICSMPHAWNRVCLQPVREWCDPGELSPRSNRARRTEEQAFEVNVANDLPPISVDARLIEQALDCAAVERRRCTEQRSADRNERRRATIRRLSFRCRSRSRSGRGRGEQSFRKILSSVPAPRPADSGSVFRSLVNSSKRTAARSSRKIAKAVAHAFSFAFPSAKRCDCLRKRRHETDRADHR